MSPLLSVLVDGDPQHIYAPGDKVTGRVVFVAEKQEQVKSLKLNFTGVCITKTTRPFYVGGNENYAVSSSRQIYKEKVPLFNLERVLMTRCTAAANKCSWSFEFQFPENTQTRCSRWGHRSHYNRDIHPLPPSFHAYTNEPGGKATIKYSVQAKLIRSGLKANKRASYTLPFSNPSRRHLREPRTTSHILTTQTTNSAPTLTQKLSHLLTRSPSTKPPGTHFVPTLHTPSAIAPGETIPISLSLSLQPDRHHRPSNPSDPTAATEPCTLTTLTITLSTHTHSTTGRLLSHPQDTLTQHNTCLSRHSLATPLPLDHRSPPVPLVRAFRLLDTRACVPSFATYTVARAYTLTVDVGILWRGERIRVRGVVPLEVLPRAAGVLRGEGEGEGKGEGEGEPLPVYERAPEYMAVEIMDVGNLREVLETVRV
jgi:hypothetical protein